MPKYSLRAACLPSQEFDSPRARVHVTMTFQWLQPPCMKIQESHICFDSVCMASLLSQQSDMGEEVLLMGHAYVHITWLDWM